MTIDDDLEKLLNNLPFFIYEHLHNYSNKEKLIEIVLDLGRRPGSVYYRSRISITKSYFMARSRLYY